MMWAWLVFFFLSRRTVPGLMTAGNSACDPENNTVVNDKLIKSFTFMTTCQCLDTYLPGTLEQYLFILFGKWSLAGKDFWSQKATHLLKRKEKISSCQKFYLHANVRNGKHQINTSPVLRYNMYLKFLIMVLIKEDFLGHFRYGSLWLSVLYVYTALVR